MTEDEQIQESNEEILKEQLRENVEIACKQDLQERLKAVDFLIDKLKESTSSMTSVPKPMKHLVPYLDQLKQAYDTFSNQEYRLKMADLLSLLTIINIDTSYDILTYRLASPIDDIGAWGHEYVRCLTLVITRTFENRSEFSGGVEQLNPLIDQICHYYMLHNDEPDTCDLLLKVEQLEKIIDLVDEESHKRVCTYLLQCYNFLPEPTNIHLLRVVEQIYTKLNKTAQSMVVALKLNDNQLMHDIFYKCQDPILQDQLAFLLARQVIVFNDEEDTDMDDDRRDHLVDLMTNTTLFKRFEDISKSLSKSKARTPDDVLQLQAQLGKISTNHANKHMTLMAKSFVAAFHNAALHDDLYYTAPRGDEIVVQNKGVGQAVATAAISMLYLWDIENGPNEINKWFDEKAGIYPRMGALTGYGIICAAVRSEFDPALAQLSEFIDKDDENLQIGAIFGLAIAYAGSNRKDVVKLIKPLLLNENSNPRLVAYASLAIGLIYVGQLRQGSITAIAEKIINYPESELKDQYIPLLSLGLGLIFLGQQEKCNGCVELLSSTDNKLTQFARTTVRACAYAGTGNVLEIQKMLRICTGEDSLQQAAAVIGISVIALGDIIGSTMARRSLDLLLQYGKTSARVAVPIALALTSVSQPLPELVDTLHRIAHNTDINVVLNSAIAMGILAAGTQNSRTLNALKQLETFHKSNPGAVMMFQISEGLCHLGQGLMTLSPTYGDSTLIHPVALGSLMTLAFASIHTDALLVKGDPLLLYFIAPAIGPRYLVTLDEELNILPLQVRVGNAIDVVGQAGKPRAITGFTTLPTPVILAAGQRAEFVDETYEPLSPILEGFVIVRKRPGKKTEDTK